MTESREGFEQPKSFVKDAENAEMLREALQSPEIDEEIIVVLEKFLALPITPQESCYGHPEELKNPYLSYVEGPEHNEKDRIFHQKLKSSISNLSSRINSRMGEEIISINLDEDDYGNDGPSVYTIQFDVIDKAIFKRKGQEILQIVWDEFARFLADLK
jgi:hypothetical protein